MASLDKFSIYPLLFSLTLLDRIVRFSWDGIRILRPFLLLSAICKVISSFIFSIFIFIIILFFSVYFVHIQSCNEHMPQIF